MNEILDKSLKYLSISSSIVLLLGIFYSITFYGVFGISILDYIELTEALLFLVESLDLLLIPALALIATDVLNRYLYPRNMNLKNKEPEELTISLIHPFLVLASTFFLIISVFSFFESKLLPVFLHYFFLVFCFLIILLGVFFIWRSSYLKKTLFIYLLITSLFYTFCIAKYNAYGILSKNEKSSVSIKLKQETNYLNNNFRFIGKTKNYTFLFNIEKQESLVYPNELIDYYKITK